MPLKDLIKKALIEARLKYNYFSSSHPNKSLRGRLFKFLGKNKIQFLKDKSTHTLTSNDLSRGGEKLYFPADMS